MASVGPRRVFNFVCHACRQQRRLQTVRAFSTTISRNNDDQIDPNNVNLAQEFRRSNQPRSASSSSDAVSASASPFSQILDTPQSLLTDAFNQNSDLAQDRTKPYRLHVYAHKHNTHLTLVQPPRSAAETTSSRVSGARATSVEQKKVVDVLMSMSTGNIGFRKAGRGSYDAAFQLAAFVLKQIQERGILRDMYKLEVVIRGFGAGREAVTKALLGTEGRHIRTKICAVMDATRLKQGGPRSKKPRRLG